NSSNRRPCHIQHHEFRRNAPSQWHATRPNAAGHIEILSSLPNKSVAPTQWCLASIFQNPDARQADLAAVRMSSKCQMGSARYVREPHRIVRKYNARPFRYEVSQQLFGLNALYTSIRNTHEVNRVIFDLHAPAFVIKDGDGMRAQRVRMRPPRPTIDYEPQSANQMRARPSNALKPTFSAELVAKGWPRNGADQAIPQNLPKHISIQAI